MIKEYSAFKAAAVQAASVFRDKPVYFESGATLEKAVSLIAEAGQNGAKLIVLPETFLPGYPYWSLNMQKGPEWAGTWMEYLRHSIEVPSEETDLLCKAARSANAYVVSGSMRGTGNMRAECTTRFSSSAVRARSWASTGR